MTSKRSLSLYIILTGLILGGCTRKVKLKGPAPTLQMAEAYQILADHNIDFTWWAGVGKATVDSEYEKGSGKMYLRMKRDSLVWLVGKKLSLEGVRAQITPNKVTVKYPLEKVYQQGVPQDLLNKYQVDLEFTDVQHLLAGNVMLPDTSNCTIANSETGATIDYSDGLYRYQYLIDSRLNRLSGLEIVLPDSQHVSVTYGDYKPAKGSSVDCSHYRKIEMSGQGSLIIQFSDIEVDVPKKTPFSISNRYTEIPL